MGIQIVHDKYNLMAAVVPGLRPTAGKVFHPCTLLEQQGHTASHRCPGHPPYRLRIRRFLLAGYTSSRFCGAGVHFFKHPADGSPAYESLQFHTGFFLPAVSASTWNGRLGQGRRQSVSVLLQRVHLPYARPPLSLG
jgi:hypothetical protein